LYYIILYYSILYYNNTHHGFDSRHDIMKSQNDLSSLWSAYPVSVQP